MRVLLVVSAALVLPFAGASAAHGAPEEVAYECTVNATNEKQQVSVNIELTVPATAPVGEQMTIGWRGTYVTGSELIAPDTGLEGEVNLYAYAGISKIDKLTSAIGVAPLGTIIPGEIVPLPSTTVEMKTTPTGPGTGTVHVASFNLGLTPQERLIECELKEEGGQTEHPLTVGAGGSTSPTPDDTGTETTDPEPTDEESTDPEPDDTVTETPTGGAATGGGGEAGPDGRMVMGAGLVILAAAGAGLRLRRPRRDRSPRASG
ncbi:hypothetical protein [Nonomuraea sp. NPDC050643]|uniref:hypothetical protein n=1 Tax=Nonomuraea sp. NPDC050643 TaxID=3155660 RepID=UPI0033FD4A24